MARRPRETAAQRRARAARHLKNLQSRSAHYAKLSRDAVDALGLQSRSELSEDEGEVIRNYAAELDSGRSRDLSWNGPLARWLAMTGRRPIREGIDIGDYNDRRRGRRLSWEDV